MSNIVNSDLLEKLFEKYLEMCFTEEEAKEKAKRDFYQIIAI